MTPVERVNPASFRKLIRRPGDERPVAKYLRAHPWITYWTFCPASGHDRYLFHEFRLGSEFQVDIVVLNSYSGAWEVYFIELEPPGARLFTKDGRPTRRLSTAQRQIDDWRAFWNTNRDLVRQDLVRWALHRDLLRYSVDGGEPSNMTGDLLADPRTVILDNYRIIMGRSSELSAADRARAGRYSSGHSVTLVSYDRLVALAERRYGAGRRGYLASASS